MRPIAAATFAVACMLALVSDVQAQERLVPRLTVTGEASAATVPDQARIHAGVTTQGKTAREASDANSKLATAVLAALRAAAVEDKDIQTTRLTLQPTYEQNSSGRGRINGFQAANQVTVTVREVAKLADLIDRVVTAGATDIGGIEFVVSAPSQALDRARGEAVADARRKAELYAKAAGVNLGRVIALSEEQAAQPIPMFARAAAAPGPPISPGETTLRLTVTVSYELTN